MSQPAGTAAYLFTDLVGSTRLWERFPSAMQGALARHDSIMRSGFAAHDGEVFSIAGDSFGAAFATPAQAIAAAVSIQRELAAADWPEGIELRPRMGVHVGPSTRRSGNFFGSEVNRAARLMSAAHGGQVVVSQAVRDAVSGWEMLDLGEHLLKDLTAPEHVYEVVTGLAGEPFPPLHTVDRRRVHLPVQPSALLGRDADAEAIVDRMDTTRLLTIRGLGGIGKTRLSIHVGAELADEHPDGVHFVELARVTDDVAVGYALCDALSVRVSAGGSPLDAAASEIGTGRRLVIVDNCEHVIEAARDLVAVLLRSCPEIRIITTSRIALNVAGEVIYGLDPLSTATTDSSAVELFVERALAVNSSLEVGPARLAVIADLCSRLDGVPLAIELAAARCRSMTPEEVASHLDDRFALLRSRDGEIVRHRSLFRTLEWSYEHLDEESQLLLRRMSVFAGPATIAAVTEVCGLGDLDRFELLDALETLVDNSMVVADVGAAAARYRMLETIREFGTSQLGDEVFGLRARHAAYFAAEASAAAWGTLGADEGAARRRLTAIWDDLRSAVSYARVVGDVGLAAALVGDLAFEALWRQRVEASDWADAVRDMAGFDDLPDVVRAGVLVTAACGKLFDDAAADAARLAAGAGELIESIAPADFTPGVLAATSVHFFLGDLPTGIAANERLFARFGDDHPHFRRMLLASSASMLGYAGRHDDAADAARRSLAIDDPDVAPTWDLLAAWCASRFGGDPVEVQLGRLGAVIDGLLVVENEFIAAAVRRYQVALDRERESSLRSIASELRAVDLTDERYATGWMLTAAAELLATGDEPSLRAAIDLIGWQEAHRLAPIRPELRQRLDALLPPAREQLGAEAVTELMAQGAARTLASAVAVAADAAERAAELSGSSPA